jgi:hypothetical protein
LEKEEKMPSLNKDGVVLESFDENEFSDPKTIL